MRWTMHAEAGALHPNLEPLVVRLEEESLNMLRVTLDIDGAWRVPMRQRGKLRSMLLLRSHGGEHLFSDGQHVASAVAERVLEHGDYLERVGGEVVARAAERLIDAVWWDFVPANLRILHAVPAVQGPRYE